MWRRLGLGSPRRAPKRVDGHADRRDRLAMMAAVVTVMGLVATFLVSAGTHFLMPGPLASSHATIEQCSACHTTSGSGKLSWLHGLVAGDRTADSKACLTCHRMPETAFNPHGAADDVLAESTRRLLRIAAATPVPRSALAQSLAFPVDDVVARGLYCTTCHQEHQGAGYKLTTISNEQCQSCHVVKFDSFDGHHPTFEGFPFKRRTRIVFDHTGHFGKHFPETASKSPSRSIPETCSSCHGSGGDKRLMNVAPFEQTCSACHLDQIVGKERVSGPKGIAFLALPGLDLQTLRKKRATIGEWPEASEAGLTPFMKVLIGRHEKGRALIGAVGALNLQDLSAASDAQIKAVEDLVWEIKGLLYSLIQGKASDLLGGIDINGSGRADGVSMTGLIAGLPLDVVVSAHQDWLPNLGTEMANRKKSGDNDRGGWITQITDTRVGIDSGTGSPSAAGQPPHGKEPRSARSAARGVAAEPSEGPSRAGESTAGAAPPKSKPADQTDDLLFPTEDEKRAMKGRPKGKTAPVQTAQPKAGQDGPASTGPAGTATQSAPELPAKSPPPGIQTQMEAENWAVFGGWYRQDFSIFYRPTGHKDKFLHSWLAATGPYASKGDTRPTAAVFNALVDKDAQGSCTKCHSVDEVQGKGRIVNFSPSTVASKHGRFTNFAHEPHFSVLDNRGCLTCHSLEKDAAYLKSYEQENPQSFASNFGAVKKELCQTCHTGAKARQDCVLCHKYHVNGSETPIMSTKNPAR
jgi:hypothetical protein